MTTLSVEVDVENLVMLRQSIDNMSDDQIIDATQESEKNRIFGMINVLLH